MSIRVLVVDDSGFFRRRIRAMLDSHPDLEVCGEACNGREAVELAEKLRPDVITMDIEMPELDGISAVRQIMRKRPTPVLMFSSLTYEGARTTLEALEAGATDFIPKRFADISGDMDEVRQQLTSRLVEMGRKRGGARQSVEPSASTASADGVSGGEKKMDAAEPPREAVASGASARTPRPGPSARPAPQPAPPVAEPRRRRGPRVSDLELVVIGCSTGGPVALQRVLTQLPAGFPLPLVVIQHMPASFTPAFAERLNELCKVSVREANDGDVVRPGEILLAPGGRQLGFRSVGGKLSVHTFEGTPDQFYKPSVDVAFSEAAQVIPGRVLGVVLTGMGSDGAKGAQLLKKGGSWVWAQDEATSVIYGMPAAVAKAGAADQVLPLDSVGQELARLR